MERKEIVDQTINFISRALNKLGEYSESHEYDEVVDEVYELVSELKDKLLKLRKANLQTSINHNQKKQ
ncbi:MAG: hypothetical protein KME59_14430 [Trichormus sp. ATA11-4-KO1]|nr:hypothetical protein [Trichormus sp. ATA11-4-KO1]